MLRRFLPLLWRHRRLGFDEFLARAAERRILSPAGPSEHPSAIAQDDELGRILKFYRDEDQFELDRLTSARWEHGATVAHRFDEAVVGGGHVFAAGASYKFAPAATRISLQGPMEEWEEAMLATSLCAETYFGDWLIEGLGLELLAREQHWPALGFGLRPWQHEPGYRAMTGLSPHIVRFARVKHLWVVDDRGLNASRERRFRELRALIRQSAMRAERSGAEKVYLARGHTGQGRQLVNATEVESALTRAGFTIIHPEAMEPLALASSLADARIVVAVEGSAHVHALLAMADGGTLVNIQPPRRFTTPGKGMADMAGLRYAYTVGEPASPADDDDNFTMPVARLLQTIALVEAAA